MLRLRWCRAPLTRNRVLKLVLVMRVVICQRRDWCAIAFDNNALGPYDELSSNIAMEREGLLLQCQGIPPMQEVSARPLQVCTMSDGRMMRAPVGRQPRLLDPNGKAICYRHSLPAHLLSDGYNIHTVQELSVHKGVGTTMVYTHVLSRGGKGVRSPIDLLLSPGEKTCYTETI